MSVNKKILQDKSNKDLEKYIEIDSRFVPEAILVAYEILKSRGKEFTDEETQRILLLKNDNYKGEEILIHPYNKKAADLIFISGVIGLGNLIWSYPTLSSGMEMFIALFSVAFIFGIGYLVSKGIQGIKYLILILLILGLPSVIVNLNNELVVATINIIQTFLQIWSLILLFRIPKTKKI